MINNLILKRRSLKNFSGSEINNEMIALLFKAASLAPSSHNEQPWRFILARKQDPENFNRFLSMMKEKNQAWARNASVIALAVAKKNFSANNRPNKYYFYDVSSAVANLTHQALSLDLYVHQIGGFYSDSARELLEIPEDYEPVVMLAIGPVGVKPNSTNHDARKRKNPDEFVFEHKFGNRVNFHKEILI